jgi:hypothetical protein
MFAATEGAIAVLALVLLLWRRRSLSRGGGRGRGFGGGGHDLAMQLSAHRCRRSKCLRSAPATRKPTAQRLRWVEEVVVVFMPSEKSSSAGLRYPRGALVRRHVGCGMMDLPVGRRY